MEEFIEEGIVEERILSFIRHILLDREEISFMFAGINRVDIGSSKISSNFLGVVLPIELGFLDKTMTQELVVKYPQVLDKSIFYTPGAVQSIYEISGGQPNICQAICYQLVQFLNDVAKRHYVTKQDVENIQNRAMEGMHSYFLYLIDKECNDIQRSVLYIMSDCVNPVSLEILADEIEIPPTNIRKCAEDLVTKNILNRKNGKFGFRIGLLKKWLRNNKVSFI